MKMNTVLNIHPPVTLKWWATGDVICKIVEKDNKLTVLVGDDQYIDAEIVDYRTLKFKNHKDDKKIITLERSIQNIIVELPTGKYACDVKI